MVRAILILLLLGATLAAPLSVSACPLCKEAISTPDADGEVNNLPAAYNNVILMMLGVSYSSLGIVGFLIYRGVKKNAAYLARRQNPGAEPSI